MSGTMSNYYRDHVCQELRAAASRVIRWREQLRNAWLTGDYSAESEAASRLYQAIESARSWWREFPECYRDKEIPQPEVILEGCAMMERQKDEAERTEQRLLELGR